MKLPSLVKFDLLVRDTNVLRGVGQISDKSQCRFYGHNWQLGGHLQSLRKSCKRLGHASTVVGPAGGTLLFLSTPARSPPFIRAEAELGDKGPAVLHVSCDICINLARLGLL